MTGQVSKVDQVTDLSGFKWITRKGERMSPSKMDTHHVFSTWLMIWNHAAPQHLRIWFNHRYTFGYPYTPEYMLTAFKALYFELKKRDDVTPEQQKVINFIEHHKSYLPGQEN